jgi:hypothetical protein
MVAASPAFNSFNLGMVQAQIEPPYQLPDRSCGVVRFDQSLDINAYAKVAGNDQSTRAVVAMTMASRSQSNRLTEVPPVDRLFLRQFLHTFSSPCI